MSILCLLLLAAGAFAADIVDPKDCTEFPCLIFNDEFEYFDHDVWEHEQTMSGGGNWEFEVYVNNRSVSYTRDSKLFIKPALVSEWKDEAFVTSGKLNLWGMNGRGDVCTANSFWGCERVGTGNHIINPIMSARLRTMTDFAFKYGRIEVRAKMPRGDWLWPGNDDYGELGNQYGGSTLHWGPYWPLNRYELTHADYLARDGSFANSFHTWRLDWTKDKMETYVDNKLVLTVDPGTTFWEFGGFGNDIDNIWKTGEKMAPFDQKFYIILNLAVGGTNGFFPDGIPGSRKPWANTSPNAALDFWNGRDQWLPTWKQGESRISENAGLQIDYVKVWKMESIEQ